MRKFRKKWQIALAVGGALAVTGALTPAFVACDGNSSANKAEGMANLINYINGKEIAKSGVISVNGFAGAGKIQISSHTKTLSENEQQTIQAVFQALLGTLNITNSEKINDSLYRLNLTQGVTFGENQLGAFVVYTPPGGTSEDSTTPVTLGGFGVPPTDEANYLVQEIGTAPIPMDLYLNHSVTWGTNNALTSRSEQWINEGLQAYIVNEQSEMVGPGLSQTSFTIDFQNAVLTRNSITAHVIFTVPGSKPSISYTSTGTITMDGFNDFTSPKSTA